jgi:hypothetical protein
MSFTAYPTVATGDFITAALWNTYIRDNGNDLDRRTTVTGASVAAAGTTASTSYTDATVVGPAVNVTIGATKKALVAQYANLEHAQVDGVMLAGFTISGGTSLAAADDLAIAFTAPTAGGGIRTGAVWYLDSATLTSAGSTTFQEKVRVGGTAGTGTIRDRRLSVTPLGS